MNTDDLLAPLYDSAPSAQPAPAAPAPSLYAMTQATKLALAAEALAFGVALYKGDKGAAFFSALAGFTTYYASRETTARGMALQATDDARSFSQAVADRLARIEGGLL